MDWIWMPFPPGVPIRPLELEGPRATRTASVGPGLNCQRQGPNGRQGSNMETTGPIKVPNQGEGAQVRRVLTDNHRHTATDYRRKI